MKMIVGLGNPGRRYTQTRHNLGFLVADRLAAALHTAFDREKHQGLMAAAQYSGEKVLLIKPQTYMNRSGDCVAAAARNKIVDPADLLVIVDDVNLPLGRIRLRAGGSAGGHNGLKSLIERLGSDAFHRLRLGVGSQTSADDLADYVLSGFRPDERPVVEAMLARAEEAALYWLSEGMERAMNVFNKDAGPAVE